MQFLGYQPISVNGVVERGGGPTGPAGVREKRGAGAACSTPWAVITVDRAFKWSLVAASLQVNTGVAHASVPAKTRVHSSRVRLANRSAKRSCICWYEPMSSWLGTASADRPSPLSNAAKNYGSMAPTAMYLPSEVS